ncbi:MAG: 5-formyltetrahydrofolate cyclo-ligase [Gammaproteobacteria bacterium]|nr:MAG: 5-formyltetrahydrofolate cyclo-ligase [Gammaproteobacteria bacterium]
MTLRAELRKTIRAKRQALTIDEQQIASKLLLQQLSTHKKIQAAQTIALYLANDSELDLMPFIEWCWQQNKQVYLPVLHPFCSGHLLFLLFQNSSTLVKNKYGISEPILEVNKVRPLNQLDVICTPLVAFDNSGARLGMGGGFYDRTLVNWKKQNNLYPIGLAHDCQQVKLVPAQSWDIPLPEIITPSKNFKF